MDRDIFHQNTDGVPLPSHFDDQPNRRSGIYDIHCAYSNSRDPLNNMDRYRYEDKPLLGEFEGILHSSRRLYVEEPIPNTHEPCYNQYP